ncbi:MAG: isochorismate synthase MenF [Chloroflexota bacterium]
MTVAIGVEGSAARLRAALAGVRPGRTVRAVTIDLPADAPDPVTLAARAIRAGEEVAAWVRPSEGVALAGVGRAWASEPAGPDRFAAAAAAWAAIADDLAPALRPAPAGPVLLGGLGFTGEQPAPEDPWAPFRAASLVLPRLLLAMVDGRATLTAVLAADADDAAIAALSRTWDALAAGAADRSEVAPVAGAAGADRPQAISTPDRAAWDRLVRLAAGAVGRGRLDKVVLARRVALELSAAVDHGALLRQLVASAGDGVAYLFCRAGRTFAGATPERLVRTDGRAFRTVAVAGSARRGTSPATDAAAAAALLGSDKDREEHAIVVASLRSLLAPVATQLTVADAPVVLSLRHVQHLATPVEGVLRDRTGTLALAGLLHPTPAVAGAPRDAALAFIAEQEGFDRGWYAGPVGWLAPDGDGELMVALRGGIVEQERAWLFAGCGIVADSDPEREWEESRLKLRLMLEALGAGELP